jgi:acetolactate synthase-1/2/3 large subunit
MSAQAVAHAFARSLRAAGTHTVFGLPGGGNNLEVVGALQAHDIDFVLAHAETAATIMAAVHADVTGRPSAAVVTRGPGAASALNGAAQALLDRQPVLVLADTVAGGDRPRIRHQLLDQVAMFAPVTKGSAILRAMDADDVMADALALALAHPRGPVHLEFDPDASDAARACVATAEQGPPADVEPIRALVRGARRPVVMLGVGSRDVTREVRELLEGSDVPVLTTYRAKGVIPDSWTNHAGLLTGATVESEVLDAADLIVAIGVDTVELIPAQWPYDAPVVSLSSWLDPSSYLPTVHAVVGDLGVLVRELRGCLGGDWAAGSGRRFRQRGLDLLLRTPDEVHGVTPQELVRRVRALAPIGTIATVDAGAHMLVALPMWDAEHKDEVIVSSGLATMGFALPAAIGAALAFPRRRVVCFVGDGGLGMVLAELETLVRLRLPVTIVVFNDSRLSLIAVKQSSARHGGEGAVAYRETDFAQVAAGFGMASQVVCTDDDLDAAITTAFAADGPNLLDARVDPACYPFVLDAIRGPRHRSSAELVAELGEPANG